MLKVQDFKNVVLKEFREFSREGKTTLYFCELVDTDTFQTTGQMMYLGQDAFNVKALERQKVDATIQLGVFNNRSSVNVVEIKPAQVK